MVSDIMRHSVCLCIDWMNMLHILSACSRNHCIDRDIRNVPACLVLKRPIYNKPQGALQLRWLGGGCLWFARFILCRRLLPNHECLQLYFQRVSLAEMMCSKHDGYHRRLHFSIFPKRFGLNTLVFVWILYFYFWTHQTGYYLQIGALD